MLYKQGKFGEAINIAEKIVEIQKKDRNQDWQNLAVALKNLVILQKQHDDILYNELRNSNLSEETANKIRFKKSRYYNTIPTLFEEVIGIYTKKLKTENLSSAETEFEFASYLSKTQGIYPGMGSIETEKTEKLYNHALLIRENFLGESDDLTLSTVQQLANFYQNDAEFEKSLPLYQRFIKEIEKKYGKNSQYLLASLRIYEKVMRAIQADEQVELTNKQISDVTGKTEALPEFDLDLTLRNKKDVSAKLSVSPNTITGYLKKEKFLLVNILIDEKGKVIEAKAEETQDKDINGKAVQQKADNDVKNWNFKPFFYNGIPKKMKGIIWYPYYIKA